MNLLFDTNILIYLVRNGSLQLAENLINHSEKVIVSVISIGELRAIALMNNWGHRKLRVAEMILEKVAIVEVNESLINTYAEIDSYSQHRNPSYSTYPFPTPRNMGKNDLWIASTAALLGLKLVTTDNDFNHLHDVFIEVLHLKPEQLKSL